MPAAPPDAAGSASSPHTMDGNKDSYPAGVAQLPREFPQRDRYRELAPQIPEARQIPRPASPVIPKEFLGFLYPACAEFRLIQNTTRVVILSVPIPIGTLRTST